jgi:predicted dehydrogenase
MSYTVAIIGTGADPDDPNREGYAMAYRHAAGYDRLDDCELIACADIVRANAERFAAEFDVEGVYEDYERMLQEVQPDVVSVCVPPSIHAEIVVGCAESGVVEAIHCEKPMAETWADCRRMVEVCDERGVQLTINHQRRFGAPFREAKSLLDGGAIGSLRRVEFATENLYDSGTHAFDLCNYYADGAAVEWVLAGIDYREENVWFGTHNENQGLTQWRYDNGVFGLASTGYGSAFVGCYLRLLGSEGAIEIGVEDGPPLRVRRAGSNSWETVDTDGEDLHGPSSTLIRAGARTVAGRISERLEEALTPTEYVDRAVADVLRAVRTDGGSELSAENALRADELTFASWESVRRRGRVELPLTIEDNPLAAMVESGQLRVEPSR